MAAGRKEEVGTRKGGGGGGETRAISMTAVLAISTLASSMGRDKLKTMLDAVLSATKDPVPNCRFNACKAIQTIAPVLEPQVLEDQVRPALQALAGDEDTDVKYFATRALLEVAW